MPEEFASLLAMRCRAGAIERGQGSTAGAEEAKGSETRERKRHTRAHRRDFLYVATGMAGVVGAGAVAWPFIDQMRPDASTLALASIEVDVAIARAGHVADGQMARQAGVHPQPHAEKEMEDGKAVQLADLKDPIARNANLPADAPATDVDRSAGKDKENWIVMVGSAPISAAFRSARQGDFGGWFCPCHGSHYDTAGRIRKGPAPENLAVPAVPVHFRHQDPDRLRQGILDERVDTRPIRPRPASRRGSMRACRCRGWSMTASSPIRFRAT